MLDHPIIVEFREEMHKRFPNLMMKIIYFRWDEGKYAEKFQRINDRLEEIENQLDETIWKDKKSQQKLKQQLLDQIPLITKLYQDASATLSEEELASFANSLEKYKDHDKNKVLIKELTDKIKATK
jgi:archaellum component FlaC